ncbi:MAG: hypothetical protein LCI00_26775 [Chloroflexi bacterium]|nr:hypothetical protein [Chloroflexota bacterium]MCC6893948.1 hypothetical protein [Anaerolineae bacterium]
MPVIHSAILSGRGSIRFKGVTFSARWRFIHQAGCAYRHYIEATVLGHPLLKVNEYYLDGHSRLELPFGVVEDQPKVDMAANLSMWSESVWLPSILLTDPRVRWEAIDDEHARLTIPFQNTTDTVVATFDPQTHMLRHFESMRYREADSTEKVGWRNEMLEWQFFQGIRIPCRAAVQWLDESSPWFTLTVDEVVYNVDVESYIRSKEV